MDELNEIAHDANNPQCSGALYNLASCYLLGFGVKPNVQDALDLLRRSAEAGHPKASTLTLLHASETPSASESQCSTCSVNNVWTPRPHIFLDWFRAFVRDQLMTSFKGMLGRALGEPVNLIEATKSLEELIKKSSPYEKIGSEKLMTIHFAVIFGEEHHVAQLIEQGANLNALSVHGDCPLTLAVKLGKYSLMHRLVEYGADCAPTSSPSIPLHWIFMLPCEYIQNATKILVERGGINSCLRVRRSTHVADVVGLWGMPMHCCLTTGCEIGLLSLLESGASINAWASNTTILEVATALHLSSSVRLLLERGASTLRGMDQAIISITQCDASTIYQRFLLHGIDLELSAVLTAETYVAYGQSLDSPNRNGRNALMISLEGCACLNHVTNVLIASGANLEAKGTLGYPVLWFAVAGLQRNVGSEEPGLYKVELLLSQGINVDACGMDGMTALHVCAVYDLPLTAQLLIQYGANVDALSVDLLKGNPGSVLGK